MDVIGQLLLHRPTQVVSSTAQWELLNRFPMNRKLPRWCYNDCNSRMNGCLAEKSFERDLMPNIIIIYLRVSISIDRIDLRWCSHESWAQFAVIWWVSNKEDIWKWNETLSTAVSPEDWNIICQLLSHACAGELLLPLLELSTKDNNNGY